MRRRNKQLENKLATLYVQLKDKDEALKQIHEEYHLTKTNLEKSNMAKALAWDEQNDRLHNLEKSINTMAAGTFIPDLVKLNQSTELQSGPPTVNTLYTGLATGENIIRVKHKISDVYNRI